MFGSLFFAINRGMGREGEKFYGKLASKISEKRCQPYSVIWSWIRKKINFSLMKSICICLRSSRTLKDFGLLNSMSEDAEASEKTSTVKGTFPRKILLYFWIVLLVLKLL